LCVQRNVLWQNFAFGKKFDSSILDFKRKFLGFLAGTFPIFFQNSTQLVSREILGDFFSGKKCKSISFSERKEFGPMSKLFSTYPGEHFEEKFIYEKNLIFLTCSDFE